MHSKWDRHVIPKWRASKVTADLPESRPISESIKRSLLPLPDIDAIAGLVEEWHTRRSIGVAADLLNLSHVPEALPLIRVVAEEVLRQESDVPVPLLEVAKRIAGVSEAESPRPDEMGQVQNHYHRIAATLKKRLRENPRNPIALVDLALVYAALGQDEKARDAVLMAVTLNANNRFVLRSAARLLIHMKQADRAMHILQGANVLRDPWLLAPLISTTAILEKPQKYLRKARLLFSSGSLHPVHLSELGAALATVQIIDGDIKSAKRTFNAALVSPNDNTVAQAMWAAENFSISISAREEWFANKFSCEGRYYQRYSEANFEGAMKAAVHWFGDEPFSTRPMKAACFISALLGKNEESEKFALKGLRLNKDDVELRNNLIFAMGSQNKIEEASIQLQNVLQDERRKDGRVSPHSMANIGMLLYRTGNLEDAEGAYRKAIEGFEKSGNIFSSSLASAFMAREALIADAPNATVLMSEAKEINKDGACAAGNKVLDLLHSGGASRTSEQKKNGQSVTYDRSRNVLLLKKQDPFR